MGAVYFLAIIGTCIGALVWALERSKAKTNLARKHRSTRSRRSSKLLTTPPDHRLANKKQIWETRRKFATKDFSKSKRIVPGSNANAKAEYDGYSRRDRHHLAPKVQVAEDDREIPTAGV